MWKTQTSLWTLHTARFRQLALMIAVVLQPMCVVEDQAPEPPGYLGIGAEQEGFQELAESLSFVNTSLKLVSANNTDANSATSRLHLRKLDILTRYPAYMYIPVTVDDKDSRIALVRLANVFRQMGFVHAEMGNQILALSSYRTGLMIMYRTGFNWHIAKTLDDIGRFYEDTDSLGAAIQVYKEAVEWAGGGEDRNLRTRLRKKLLELEGRR